MFETKIETNSETKTLNKENKRKKSTHTPHIFKRDRHIIIDKSKERRTKTIKCFKVFL